MPVSAAPDRPFTNPLLPYGPDPWATCHDGFYYYMHSTRTNLAIWKTRDLTNLDQAERKEVWTAPETGPYSKNVWSPELHYLRGRWYVYFSAEDERGNSERRRMWVLENQSADPLAGQWTFRGEVRTPDDKWAIDGTVFDVRGQLYFAWSGWAGDANVQQNIYLCRMSDPVTCVGERLKLSEPALPWERHNHDSDPDNPRNHIFINEGPAPLQRGNRVFITYSASGCWTDEYCLGMLSAPVSANLMDPAVWSKSEQPVFQTSPEQSVYAPGHNCFFRDAAGQDWLLYHANAESGQGCENQRSPRMQPVRWLPDGRPDFGTPVSTEAVLERPA